VAGSIDFLLSYVNERAVLRAKDVVIVHGAAASWNGHGLVLPAPMDSGKTTLVAGLTRAGLSYLTDDAVVFDPEALVVRPFPKSLRLEAPSLEAIPGLRRRLSPEYPWRMRLQYHVTPDDLRPHSIGGPCHVRYVIVPRFEEGADTVLEPITRAAGLLALAQNCSNLERFGGGAIRVLGEAMRSAECYRLQMGDLDSAVRAVRARIRANGRSTGSRSVGLKSRLPSDLGELRLGGSIHVPNLR
jgi:hypothetical protein